MQAVIRHFSIQKDQIAFILKWLASIIQIFGYTATAMQLTPLNMYLFSIGIIGWLGVGLLWNDKAIILIHIVAMAAMLVGIANS